MDIQGSHIGADIHKDNAFLVCLHGMPCCIQTLVTKSSDGAFWGRYDSIDERLGNIELDLVAFDKDVYNVRSSYRFEQRIDLFARLIRLNLQLAAFGRQSLGTLDQISLRTCQSNRTVSVQTLLAHVAKDGRLETEEAEGEAEEELLTAVRKSGSVSCLS